MPGEFLFISCARIGTESTLSQLFLAGFMISPGYCAVKYFHMYQHALHLT